jgi:transposase InsO family protein
MVTMFDDSLLHTIGNLQMFLQGTLPITFSPLRKEDRSKWIRSTLIRFKYIALLRPEKTILRRYLSKVADMSRAQLGRHIAAYRDNRPIAAPYVRHQPFQRYTRLDIELLAITDNAHGRMNGKAMQEICAAQCAAGDHRFIRLARISSAQVYRLRQHRRYREEALTIEKTKPVQRSIGERRKPEPFGAPGFLRVDTVHQGDFEKEKGVYHINLVDEVTQWEVIVAVEKISEECVEPALEFAFSLFPFFIRNFHSDNGSEYINDIVRQFLHRFVVKQTKSRPRHSNDNGLAETKNGAVIRKHMGYRHIPQPYAARINVFYREHLIPYVNFHRPCAFPDITVLPNGKKIVKYKEYKTPLKKLLSLNNPEQYLRAGITLENLCRQASEKLPNQAAEDMQEAKRKLFSIIPPHQNGMM